MIEGFCSVFYVNLPFILKFIKVTNIMAHSQNIHLVLQPAAPNMMNRRPRWLIPPEEVCVFSDLHACLFCLACLCHFALDVSQVYSYYGEDFMPP